MKRLAVGARKHRHIPFVKLSRLSKNLPSKNCLYTQNRRGVCHWPLYKQQAPQKLTRTYLWTLHVKCY